jgi:cell wall assembly regulator SMI1
MPGTPPEDPDVQKFTRALTREIEVGGERLAVTLDASGLSFRLVGSRRQPRVLDWAGCLCAAVQEGAPTDEQVRDALAALEAGPPKEAPATPAEIKPGGPSLPELLGRIDAWIATHRPRFSGALRPGATDVELEALRGALGQPVPEELEAWLRWHNGQSAEVIGAFEGGFNLMSADQIGTAKRELDGEGHPGWQASFVPFLDDDRDNYLLLDLAADPPCVRECWRAVEEHSFVAPSLTAWVEDFVAALERGAYHEDSERGTFHRG